MKRSAVVVAALQLASWGGGGAAGAQQPKATAQEKLASVDYLLGSWKCAHTVGTFAGEYTTTWARVLGGRWLKETYDFPPRNFGGSNETTVTAEALIGYDEPRGKWVRFFAASTGDYFPIRMKDTGGGAGGGLGVPLHEFLREQLGNGRRDRRDVSEEVG